MYAKFNNTALSRYLDIPSPLSLDTSTKRRHHHSRPTAKPPWVKITSVFHVRSTPWARPRARSCHLFETSSSLLIPSALSTASCLIASSRNSCSAWHSGCAITLSALPFGTLQLGGSLPPYLAWPYSRGTSLEPSLW